jgi:glycosyltransferase involved in cell wall biosynthesis
MARELQRHGIKVKILTAMPNYPTGEVFPGYRGRWRINDEVDGIAVTRTWNYPGTGKSPLIRLANYFSFTAMALVTALTGPRPDVMFVESQPLSLGFIAVLMKWLRKVPYIYNVPDLQVDVAEQLGFMKNRLALKLALKLENYFLQHAWKVSTVTHLFMDHFCARGLPRKNITFLPNGADTEFLKPRVPSQELLTRWNLRGKKVFLYVGTHAYYHGLEVIVQTADLLKDNSTLAFLMVGNGPEKRRLQTICRERRLQNVIFAASPYEEMDLLYSIAYASIASLRNLPVAEGMRLSKVFPSLSCGVPVIYSGSGEAACLIEANKCGSVVPPEEPSLLADAILALASNPLLREEMGRAGRCLVEKDYSWSAIIARWLDEIGFQANPDAGIHRSLVRITT